MQHLGMQQLTTSQIVPAPADESRSWHASAATHITHAAAKLYLDQLHLPARFASFIAAHAALDPFGARLIGDRDQATVAAVAYPVGLWRHRAEVPIGVVLQQGQQWFLH